ncbi:DUF7657 domain-containing protein [Peptoanaerobacter stomatis]|uniref:DUF7657 domain-containing protein n=1 Tax=Peptoanaerobacter stomatis TaxID=796937 RepID=UPI003FA09CA0
MKNLKKFISNNVLYILLFILFNIILFNFLSNYSVIKLKLQFEKTTDKIYLFYDNLKDIEKEYPFDDSNMKVKDVVSNGTTYEFIIPNKNVNKIRIDFGQESQKVVIKELIYKNMLYEELKITQKDFNKVFQIRNDIENVNFDENEIFFDSIGSDPYIASYNFLEGINTSFDYKFFLFVEICILIFIIIIKFIKQKYRKMLYFTANYILFLKKKSNLLTFFCCVISGICIAFIIEFFILKIIYSIGSFSYLRFYFFSIVFSYISILLFFDLNKIVRYRYFIALTLLILLVSGKFSGSSLGFYDGMLLDNTKDYKNSTLLGTPRGIRGDEWATEKPLYFAQIMSENKLEYFNTNLYLKGGDMVISAFAPVKDIIIVTRLDLLGFLFLEKDYAFSFYWNLRLILLFMALFEFFYLFTKKNAWYSIVFATCIFFAPPIQWWLSQTIIIMIYSGLYFIVLYNNFLIDKNKYREIFYSIGMALFSLIYIFSLYPAVQIPLGIVFLTLLIYISFENRKEFFTNKTFLLYLFILVIDALFIYRFFSKSAVAINTMMNTVYPGKNRPWIPLNWDYELSQIVNLFTSIKAPNFLNQSELSQFWIVFPFLPIVIIRNYFLKRKITLSFLLFIVSSLLFIISRVEYNFFIARILFLGATYPVRLTLVYGFGYSISLFLYLFEAFSETRKENNEKNSLLLSVIVFLMILFFVSFSKNILEYFLSIKIGLFLLVSFFVFYCYIGYNLLLNNNRSNTFFLYLFLILNVSSTVMVNPLVSGTDSMFEKTLMKEIRRLNYDDNGRWLVSGSPTIANLVAAQGVSRISGTYYYPDLELIKIIDPTGENFNILNQFAHLDIRLSNSNKLEKIKEDTDIRKVDGTNRIVYIDITTLENLGIKYIVSNEPLNSEIVKKNNIKLVFSSDMDSWKIYKLK